MATRLETLEDWARVYHALGDKTRLHILELLAGGEMNVGALCKKLKLPQSLVSHHLSLLRVGGLIKNRSEGRRAFYSLADLTKHRLGKKTETAKARTNSAKFGPVELILPQK